MKKIIATKMTSTHCKGCVYDVSEEEAKALIDEGLAAEYKDPVNKKKAK